MVMFRKHVWMLVIERRWRGPHKTGEIVDHPLEDDDVKFYEEAEEVLSHFTFDACRHGGMTELEEAALTDGQGRALSVHRTQQSHIGYAKRTEKRVLAATRKRHAHRRANQMATDVPNEQLKTVQNEVPEQSAISE